MRETPLITGEHYHIFNRGIDKRFTFLDADDVARFLMSMEEFNVEKPIGSILENQYRKATFHQLGHPMSKLESRDGKLVEFISYCINPNHFHFILEQVAEKGIEKFMQRLGNGYTKYFNHKYKRDGALFKGKFKSLHIGTQTYLLHLSAYVNLNNKVHRLSPATNKFVKSSWGEYTGKSKTNICKKDIVLAHFKNNAEYQEFAEGSIQNTIARRYEESVPEYLLLE